MKVRYSLLNYLYTLFYHAHTSGDTVMRALAWEFPADESLRGTYSQFMLGPSLLITPVLVPNVDTVQGVFPGVGEGEKWYDWYTLQVVKAKAQENVTLAAPLEHINVHVRGGSILPLQEPGYTTTETRANPWGILVALDSDQKAKGDLYLDDGESLVPNATKILNVSELAWTLRRFPLRSCPTDNLIFFSSPTATTPSAHKSMAPTTRPLR
jgi:alpha-glucosidase